jgi:exopolysaccharide biosynthesis polyprenyl glycosylphosphotransferase
MKSVDILKQVDPSAPPSPSAEGLPAGRVSKDSRTTADVANSVAMIGDLAVVLLGLLAGYWIRFESEWIPREATWWTSPSSREATLSEYMGLILVGTILLWISGLAFNLYDRSHLLKFRQVALIIAKATTLWFVGYLSLSLVLKFQPAISRIYALSSYVTSAAFLLGWRWMFHRVLRSESIARSLRQDVLFVGWSTEADRLYRAIHADPNQPYRIVGCVPTPTTQREQVPPDLPLIGSMESLEPLLQRQVADMICLADLDPARDDIVELANACEREHIQFKVIPSYFQILLSGLELESVSGVPILGVTELPLDRMHNRILKRTVDIVGGIVGLLLSLPIIAVCGGIVRWESPGSIFYRQVRTGRRGQDFEIIKIRSMRLDAEKEGGAQWAKKDDPRRLRIGTFMRRWNLDEVPQFWNVLKGEMSLVGPRPERPELIASFKYQIPHYNARHAAKPGITGWAQVNGLRGDTDLAERIRYDLWYLENWSLWLDFQIMVQTFFKRDNAY